MEKQKHSRTMHDSNVHGAVLRLRFLVHVAVVLLLLGRAAQSSAQEARGTIAGTVREAERARPLSGAEVRVVGSALTAVTDEQGRFRIDAVPSGRWTIEARLLGRTTAVTSVTVTCGGTADVELQLSNNPMSLEQLVVTATRMERSLVEAPAAVTVVSRDEIANRGAHRVADALVGTPSIRITDYSDGFSQGIQIRSLGESGHYQNAEVLVLVDGVPQLNANSQSFLDQVPFEQVERIEVVRGPSSALYGRNAIAGTVNIITRRPSTTPNLTAELNIGSFGSVKPRVSGGASLGERASFLLSASLERVDGWRERTDRESEDVFAKLFVDLVAGSDPLSAQSRGAVAGVVRADDGGPLAGVAVQVEGTSLGGLTDAQGRYRINAIPVGERVLVARAVGYGTAHASIELRAGETAQLDVVLEPAAVALGGIVVTAARREQQLQDAPAAISVVDAAEFERRAAISQGQELIGVPGVNFESAHEGTYGSVQIRGTPSEHHNDTFVALVDGIPFVTNSDESDLERILPLAVVERVEVLRGPTSALYGRGGVSGALNYITRNAFTAPRLDLAVDGGSYGYVRPRLGLTLPLSQRNRLLVHGFYERKDGWRDGSDRESANVFLKDQWLVGEGTSLSGYFNHYYSRQAFASHIPVTDDGTLVAVPGGESANHQIENPFDRRRLTLGTVTLDHAFTPRLSLKATLQARDVNYQTNIGFIDSFDAEANVLSWSGYASESDYSVLYAEPQLTFEGGPLRLIAGGSVERLSGGSDTFWTGQYGFTPSVGFLFYAQRRDLETGEWLDPESWVTDQRLDVDYANNIYGAYAQLEWDFVPRATLSFGARFDSFGRDAEFAEIAPQGTVIPDTVHSERNERISPKASLTVRWTPNLTTYASYGEGFAPAFGLISGFRSRGDGLEPEVARNYEVGVKGGTAGGRLAFAATAYRLDRRDLLVQMFGTGEDRIRFTNAGGQHAQGIELESRAALDVLVPGLGAYLSYAYTESVWDDYRFIDEFTEEEFDFSDKDVAGVPPHMLTLRLEQQATSALELAAWYDYRSDYYLDRPATIEGGRYGLLNANVRWAPSPLRGAEIALTALNLLDERYYSYYSTNTGLAGAYPGRRRELVVSLRYRP